MAGPELPPPRPVVWPLRPPESARTAIAHRDGLAPAHAELRIREALGRDPDHLLDIDTTWPGRLIFNQLAHRRAFPPRRIQPWTRHHIEEIGNLEHFLPGLFRERADEEVGWLATALGGAAHQGGEHVAQIQRRRLHRHR